MQATDARSASTFMIVGLFAASFIGLTILLNILVFFIPFDNPAMGLLIVFAAGGAAATNWFSREKAVPTSGRAWKVALICGVVSGTLSAALAVLGLSGDAQLWGEFSRAGVLTIALIFVAVVAVQVLFARLGFWLTFRQVAKKAAQAAKL
jgi:hypothetical protein